MNEIRRFIGGTGRSNTTVLARMLSVPKSIVLLNELNIIRRLFEYKALIQWKSLLDAPAIVNQICADMFRESTWYEVNRARAAIWGCTKVDVDPYALRQEVLTLEQNIRNRLEDFRNNSPLIADEYIHIITRRLEGRQILFKQPCIEIELSKIARLKTETPSSWRFLYTIKNLLDVATSYIRDQMLPGQDFHDILNVLEQRVIYSCLAIRQLPEESIMFVHDQELFTDPKSVILKAASFLELDFDASAVLIYDQSKRKIGEGENDPVVARYRDRIEWLRSSANIILGRNVW